MYGYDAIMALQFKINYWMFTVLRISVEQNRKRIKNKIHGKTNAQRTSNMGGS